MGSINLKKFEKKKNKLSSKPYTYVDLTLDLEPNYVTKERIESNGNKNYRDIKVSYDERAIKNSLINIFNTIPGQRFLIPLFGSNLVSHLFKPVSVDRGRLIGEEMQRAIELWEPRVEIDRILVAGDPDSHTYNVEISLILEQLKIRTNLTGIIGQDGFKESTIE